MILSLFLLSTELHAQSPVQSNLSNGGAIEMGISYGKIIKHRDYFRPTITRPTVCLDASYNIETKGRKYWHSLHNYPSIRLKAVLALFGDKDIFGFGLGALPVLSVQKGAGTLTYRFEAGMGIAYISKTYDDFSNPINNVISVHLNNVTQMGCQLQWAIDEKTSLIAGGSFTHFSNGKYNSPNLGINILALNLALKHRLDRAGKKFMEIPEIPNFKRFSGAIMTGMGIKELQKEGGPKFPNYTFSLQGGYQRKAKSRHLLSFDLRHFRGLYHNNIQHEVFPDRYFERSLEGYVFIGHEFLMAPFAVSLQTGVQIVSPPNRVPDITNRLGKMKIGLRVYPFHPYDNPRGLLLAMHLAADYAKASFFELALGYHF